MNTQSRMKWRELSKNEIDSIRESTTGYIFGEKTKYVSDESIEEIVNLRDRVAEIWNSEVYPKLT